MWDGQGMTLRGVSVASLLLLASVMGAASLCACSSPAPIVSGFDRKQVARKEFTAFLADNPSYAARDKKDREEAKRLAEEEAKRKALEEAEAKKDAEEKAHDALVAKIDAALDAAHAALARKDFAEAKKKATEVLTLDAKGNAPANAILGDVSMESKAYGDALASYRKAITLAPDTGAWVVRASHALDKLGRAKEGRDALREFVAKHPAKVDGEAYVALGWLEFDQGDLKRAEDAFRAAEKVSEGKEAEAFYGLALLAASKPDGAEVERTLVALFKLEPERRIEVERDPAFFRARLLPKVKALFSPALMAEAKAALAKKKPKP